MSEWILGGTVAELEGAGAKVIKGKGHGIALFFHEGNVYAVDNRCPHMGFPLHKGSLKDCILTCEWHHARFDLTGGGCLDPWADNVTTYATEVREGEVWVHSLPRKKQSIERYRQRLQEGLEQNISLVIAKAIVGLIEAGESPSEIVRIGVQFGTTYRMAGWRSGLTILTAMVNILPHLDRQGQILALYQGMVHIARESTRAGMRFMLEPLPNEEVDKDRLFRWYRQAIEVRDTQGAERILLTMIRAGASENELSDMMMAAVTDHFYMDVGHALDFHNKAFEVLEHVGVEERASVLTSLLPQMAGAERSEERYSWQSPIDLVMPLKEAFAELEGVTLGSEKEGIDEEELVNKVLTDDPIATIHQLTKALKEGVDPARLAQLVSLAAMERIAHFHTQNDFGDWVTALHTFTHTHAVHKGLLRSPSMELVRGIYHSAMSIYLDRFLNVPKAKKPKGDPGNSQPAPDTSELLKLLDKQQQVAEAAEWVAVYLDRSGDKDALFNVLGHALLREDAEFHSFQMLEAAIDEHDRWEEEDTPIAQRAMRTSLLAVTRYLAAHAPTARELPHTASIAWRLHRGERLFEE
ncbi:Ferredoxin subunit of nitrite reductase or a ring-hydroxylating dioxygenase [Marininema mesophilum]|uniref:Ferredoxin subunit of nitrite reductase or a ring-hydroxylating dioxygenase n=1 Tax=Marininema mesophilum TaxID=1048340 RepID=A0A1H2VTJ1_9BACL|nr:Rieske (2Fe-2S) protein [Marininema mesophilum]SDW71159.1 Ferredoxin subunit of nitrite reductase or a ring-hydroxylating dioxygenase [Marininema mesophilum]